MVFATIVHSYFWEKQELQICYYIELEQDRT